MESHRSKTRSFRKVAKLTIVTRQMHRELKLQHALLQQIAQNVGVSEQATEEMRKLVNDAPEGASVAALIRTAPMTGDGDGPQLSIATAETEKRTSSESNSDQGQMMDKREV